MLEQVGKIDQNSLKKLLSARFNLKERKLSQIPQPSLLLNASLAAKKIATTIESNKKITLIGDYDVDGVSASAIVVNFFKNIPYPIEVIIPNRFSDGYGINANILKRVEADLIITVDNGISAIEAGEICQDRKIDLIITDHHTPLNTLPKAYAIVNPKLDNCSYPIKEICGAEVAWLVLAELKKELNLSVDMKEFIDILAIAIIADIMPLVDINRTLVKEGLKYLKTSTTPYATIIRDFLNKKTISSEDIAFLIAPRINSAGRIDDASIALEFFTTSSMSRAYEIFELLGTLNNARKEQEALITKEAMALANPNDKIIVVAKEGWHEGIVGIVASKLVEYFEKPSIVLSIDENEAKGSARSLGNIDIHSLIKDNSNFLLKFGGHKMAAGLSLKTSNIKDFLESINSSASAIKDEEFILRDDVVGILPKKEINLALLDILESFEPYGEANKRPSFLIKEADILRVEFFGKEKNHSKIYIQQNTFEEELELLLFKKIIEIPHNKKITCSYSLSLIHI